MDMHEPDDSRRTARAQRRSALADVGTVQSSRSRVAATPAHAAELRPSPPARGPVHVDVARGEVRRAAYLACWIWPSFTLLDVYMTAFLYPSTPAWRFLAMRVGAQVLLLIAYAMSRSPTATVAGARLAFLLSVQVCVVFMVLMALDFGGLNSTYMHGISLAILVIAVVVPAHWQAAMRTFVPYALTYPVIMAVAATSSPELRAAWLDEHAVLTFISQYIFVLAIVLVGAISSHFVWAARRQVYQARKLGRYRLEAPIGEGGMNQVWLAWDDPLHRHVALKILRAEGAPEARAVQRFEREARAASRLVDPHTIRIFDFGASDDGVYYLAMEYLRGADLAALVGSHGALPPGRAVHFAAQTCASLIEAHEAGIIHRDVKPQNLFVTRVGDDHDFLKLLDFGIARVIEVEHEVGLTQTGLVAGTPMFMAPEVCRGEPADARSDLYSLGATMYYMLTGSPPFVGASAAHLITAHLLHTPERPSTRRGQALPEALEQLVLRCLEKDPAARFPSAKALAAALARLAAVIPWTPEDSRRFWQVERVGKQERWEAPTLDPVEAVSR